MERFGFPSRIVGAHAEGGGMCWIYERPGPDGEELNDITLWFQDGYLLHLLN